MNFKILIPILSLMSISSTYAGTKVVHGVDVPTIETSVEIPDGFSPLMSLRDQIPDSSVASANLTDMYYSLLQEKNIRALGKKTQSLYSHLDDQQFEELLSTVEKDWGTRRFSAVPTLLQMDVKNSVLRSEADNKRGYFLTFVIRGYKKPPTNSQELCAQFRNKEQNDLLQDTDNNLSFLNRGGFFNKGVCWWHSSMTRAASYLAIFKPNAPQPNGAQVRDIIARLARMDQVVEIPGFDNLHSFSTAYENTIIKQLESMQMGEVLGFNTRGMEGNSENDPRGLRAQMDRAYSDISTKREPVYVMLQKPGIEAHAWLIVRMDKKADGYLLYIHDSNYTGIQIWKYKYGMRNFVYLDNRPFIPYVNATERTQLQGIQNTLTKYCGGK
jgi:hypothetical protein